MPGSQPGSQPTSLFPLNGEDPAACHVQMSQMPGHNKMRTEMVWPGMWLHRHRETFSWTYRDWEKQDWNLESARRENESPACLWRISIHYEYLGRSLAPNISFIARLMMISISISAVQRPAAALIYPAL